MVMLSRYTVLEMIHTYEWPVHVVIGRHCIVWPPFWTLWPCASQSRSLWNTEMWGFNCFSFEARAMITKLVLTVLGGFAHLWKWNRRCLFKDWLSKLIHSMITQLMKLSCLCEYSILLFLKWILIHSCLKF